MCILRTASFLSHERPSYISSVCLMFCLELFESLFSFRFISSFLCACGRSNVAICFSHAAPNTEKSRFKMVELKKKRYEPELTETDSKDLL